MSCGVAPSQVAEEIECSGLGRRRWRGEGAFESETAGDSTKKIGAGFAAHFARRRFMLLGRIRNVTRSLLFLRLHEIFVFTRRQQAVYLARLADLDFDHPPFGVR